MKTRGYIRAQQFTRDELTSLKVTLFLARTNMPKGSEFTAKLVEDLKSFEDLCDKLWSYAPVEVNQDVLCA